MYVKCGSLDEAYIVFDKSAERDAVLWGVMIAGYVQQDEGFTALQCFEKMQQEGAKPTNVIFLSILKACASVGAIEQGRLIHDQIVKCELQFDVFVENTLIDMYAKCGSLNEAHSIFSKSPIRNVVSWNAMITGYTQHCDCSSALEFFEIMQREGIKPTTITFLSVLKACAFLGEIVQGRLLHGHIIQKNYESDETLENTLLDMYAKCGSVEEACRIFEGLKDSNIVAQNAMISGYAQHGQGLHALEVFWAMQEAGIMSNNVTYLGVLKSCSTIGMIQMGRLIHEEAVESGLESDVAIGSALIDMYSKCGSLMESKLVFDTLPSRNVVCWGAMISAYALSEGHLALECYEMMLQIGIKPARATFLSILKACSNVGAIHHGRLVHEQIIQSGLQVDIAIGNTLIDMYAKCGRLGDSSNIFNEMENRNIVSWSVMIAAYAQDEEGLAALECFERMQLEGVEPNDVTFLSLLKACASVGAVGQARLIYEKIIKYGLQLDVFMENAIVDMHAKCGDMNAACKFFNELAYKTLVSWNAMIVGYAQHGDGHLALECFERMQKEGIKPNEVSFTSIFVAYSHVGLVDEGLWYFKFMTECCGIIPASSHYTSMVDLLGGLGYFDEAEKLMQASFQPNVLGWVSLLNACKIYGNTECGKHCFDQIVVSNSSQMAAYILMSNLYADAHMEDGYRVDELRKCISVD